MSPCPRCGTTNKTTRNVCMQCHDELRRAAYRAANPHVFWAGKYRNRAKALGFEPVVEKFTREDVVKKYGNRCAHCKAGAFEQLDHHPVPVAAGGPHTLSNVRPSCRKCNVAGAASARRQRRQVTNSLV